MPVSIIRPPSTSSIWLPSSFSAWQSHPLAHTSRTVPARIRLNGPSSVPSHHQLTISSILPSRASSLHTQLPHPPRTQSHPHMHVKDRSSKNLPTSFNRPPPASSLELASETTSLHYLCHLSHEAAFLRHLHCPCLPSTSEGSLPHRSGIFGSLPFRLRIHAGLDRLLKGV
jgi:hypothetical protein